MALSVFKVKGQGEYVIPNAAVQNGSAVLHSAYTVPPGKIAKLKLLGTATSDAAAYNCPNDVNRIITSHSNIGAENSLALRVRSPSSNNSLFSVSMGINDDPLYQTDILYFYSGNVTHEGGVCFLSPQHDSERVATIRRKNQRSRLYGTSAYYGITSGDPSTNSGSFSIEGGGMQEYNLWLERVGRDPAYTAPSAHNENYFRILRDRMQLVNNEFVLTEGESWSLTLKDVQGINYLPTYSIVKWRYNFIVYEEDLAA